MKKNQLVIFTGVMALSTVYEHFKHRRTRTYLRRLGDALHETQEMILQKEIDERFVDIVENYEE